jgi:F0F1-type ATP synthase assembly protein I
MSLSNDPSNKNPWLTAFNMKTLTVGGEVGCSTLLIVLVAVFGGLWLDQILGTKPLITVILVLASAPLSLMLTVWIATRAVKDLNLKAKQNMNPSGKIVEGEEDK